MEEGEGCADGGGCGIRGHKESTWPPMSPSISQRERRRRSPRSRRHVEYAGRKCLLAVVEGLKWQGC